MRKSSCMVSNFFFRSPHAAPQCFFLLMKTKFKRLKKPRRGRKKGDVFPVKPSWSKRPGYVLREGKVVPAVFEDGKMRVLEGSGSVEQSGSLKRTYKTPDQTCPELTPTKAVQRKELAEKIKGGTVLEAFAGEGHLSEKVYAKKADEIVMIDKNPELLKKADRRVAGKVKHEAIVRDNVSWLENEMKPSELKRLQLVDFDAFGSPAKSMRAFFSNFPVKRKMYVALTDGSKIFLGYSKPHETRKWLRENYGIVRKTRGTREDQVKLLDAFMQAQAQVHGFKVKPVNVAYGKHHAVYAGYEISPK